MRIPLSWTRDRVQTGTGYLGAVAGPVSLAGAVLVLVMLLNNATGAAYQDVLVGGLVYAALAVSLQVIVGNTGLIFFGQFAFVAVGAYTSGILTVPLAQRGSLLPDLPGWLAHTETSFLLSAVVAGAVAGVVALLSAPLLAKVSGLAAAVVSLGLMYIVTDVLRQAKSLTKGTQTFYGVPFDATVLSVGLVFLAITGAAALFKYSPWGLAARAGREDAVAAESTGLSTARIRVPALVLSAVLSGVAGAVWAHYLTAFSPATFGVDPAILVVMMAVIGGANSISGAIVGAVGVAAWQEFCRHVEGGLHLFGLVVRPLPEFGSLTLALGLIAVLALRPGGVLGSLELQWFRPATRRHVEGEARVLEARGA
jgi:branched-chain amino acid transport system permease protein